MPIETEIKLRVESHERVRDRLRELSATCLGRAIESNEIFDRPDGGLRRRGCGLRLRWTGRGETKGGSSGTLTFKGPVMPSTAKKREELEIQVSDAETTRAILGELGFERMLFYQKHRESWRLDDCRVELDEPPRIGIFVEIEGPDESVIRRVQSKLMLDTATPERASYVAMLSAYCDEHRILDRTLLLSNGA